jgi:hypothetical protein
LALLQIACFLGAASVHLVPDADQQLLFEIRGIDAARVSPEKAAAEIHVFVDGVAFAPRMAGKVTLANDVVRFRPRFPLQPGVSYRVEWQGVAKAVLTVPQREVRPSAFVEQVYPSASELPANLLKFYIHFSEPMSRAEAWKRLHLIDDKGVEVPLPFLEIDEELWDREGKRLTVLFDPGRIKRGLVPHNEVGPAMVAGRVYELVIDRGWLDAKGAPMRQEYRKRFRVLEDDRTPLTLGQWKLTPPPAGSREPLHVAFPEPVDRALMERMIWVASDSGSRLAGTVEVGAEERSWLFTPAAPWKGGSYLLTVAVTIEDLAGNRLDRRFDVDTFEKVEMRLTEATRTLPFVVAP